MLDYPIDVATPRPYETAAPNDSAAAQYRGIMERLRALGYSFDRTLKPSVQFYVAVMRALNELESCRKEHAA